MKADYVIALIILLTALAVRSGYEALKKAGKINPKNKILFISIFLTMLLLWISWFYMCSHDPIYLALPLAVHWIGLAVFIAGFVFAFGALVHLKGVENIDHLVTTGLFAKLRHPMYMGFTFWIFGWAIFNGAAISFISGFAVVGHILYWRYVEEQHLEKTYGERYRTYREQTWF